MGVASFSSSKASEEVQASSDCVVNHNDWKEFFRETAFGVEARLIAVKVVLSFVRLRT
jgi:hypothetical protein